MDMATIAVKELKAAGKLQNLDESDEINACTIIIPSTSTAWKKNGFSCLKMKRTTTRRKSNPSAVRQPAWGAASAIP